MSLAADIARRMLGRRQPVASAKAAPKPPKVAPRAPGTRTTARTGVGTTPAVKLRSAPVYVPPRTEPDIRALVESFAPPPVTPAPPPPVLRAGFRGSCAAVDAANGRRCKLPHHPEHPEQHRHERGMFHRVAEPGTTSFPLREALDRAAFASIDVAVDHTPTVTGKEAARRGREQRRAKGIGPRTNAHAGDNTSTGIKSIDTNPHHEAA